MYVPYICTCIYKVLIYILHILPLNSLNQSYELLLLSNFTHFLYKYIPNIYYINEIGINHIEESILLAKLQFKILCLKLSKPKKLMFKILLMQ